MRFDDHKTDGSAGVKTLPLNSHLRDIVRRRAEEGISPYVFRGWKLNRPIVGLEKMWTRVMVEVKLDPPATPHDLRRTFMSTCTDLGYPLAIGDALLGHSLGKIRDTYVHLGTEGIMATASQETADWIHGAMNGVAVKPGQKVLKEKDVESDSA